MSCVIARSGQTVTTFSRAPIYFIGRLIGPRFLVHLMCALFFGPGLWESGGVWLLLVASLELGG